MEILELRRRGEVEGANQGQASHRIFCGRICLLHFDNKAYLAYKSYARDAKKISISADDLPDPATLMNDDDDPTGTRRKRKSPIISTPLFHLACRPPGRSKKKGCIQQPRRLRSSDLTACLMPCCPSPGVSMAIPGSAHQAMEDSDKVPACSHKFPHSQRTTATLVKQ